MNTQNLNDNATTDNEIFIEGDGDELEEGEIIAGTFKKMDKQRNADNAKRL